jgi:YD repeat-containing protein
MTALIFNDGLGLTGSSLQRLNGQFGAGSSSIGQGKVSNYVNAATGNLVLSDQDEILVGRGVDVIAERTYNSLGAWDDSDANGWRFGFERTVRLSGSIHAAGSTLTRTLGDGQSEVYQYQGNGGYQHTGADGVTAQITYAGGVYTWSNRSTGAQDKFNAAGQLTQSLDADGNARNYAYDANSRITSITFGNGEQMSFEYLTSGYGAGKLGALKLTTGGVTTSAVSYVYDSSNRLYQVNNALGGALGNYTTTYLYDGASTRIRQISQSDGSQVNFTYQLVGSNYLVRTATNGTDQTLTYTYGAGSTTITDGQGRNWVYQFDSAERLTQVTSPASNSVDYVVASVVTAFTYDASGFLAQVRDVTANVVTATYTYDALGNRTSQVAADGSRTDWVYSDKLLVCSSVTTAVGVATTRYVYDAEKHLRYVISPEGRVSENRYDGVGNKVASINYQGAQYATASLATTTALSEATLNSWVAAVQDKSMTSRTDYGYDGRDQLTATVAYATVDGNGNGVADTGTVRTSFSYTPQGLLAHQIVVKGASQYQTSYAYDGEGRLLASTDAAGHVVSTSYSGNTIRVTNAGGAITVSTYNAAGQLSSVAVTANDGSTTTTRTTSYVYDASGRLRMTQSPSGARSYVFYDEAGRQSATVNSDGLVTETRYNTQGQVVRTITSATPVNTSGWFNGSAVVPTLVSAIRPAAHAADRTTAFTYDKAGRLLTTVDAEGHHRTNSYDTAGNLVQSKADGDLATTGDDRVTRYFYDKDGLKRAVLDAAGYLTEYAYDGAGRLTHTIAYSTLTTAASRATGTLDALRPAAAGDDHHSYQWYDDTGRLIAQVSADGALTETLYDESANQTRTLLYRTAITTGITTSFALSTLRAAAGGVADTVATLQYNAIGQLVTKKDANSIVTSYGYNADGQLVTETLDAITTTTTRNQFGEVTKLAKGTSTTQSFYDAAGRLVRTVDGRNSSTFLYYDASGRLTHTVNALGEVTVTSYDAFGQVTETRTLATRISTSGLTGGLNTALTGLTLNNATDQRVTGISYNRLGQKISQSNAQSLATTYSYNVFGELYQTTANLSTGGTVYQAVTALSYEARGLVSATTQSAFYGASSSTSQIVTNGYDAFGNLTSVTAHDVADTDSSNDHLTQSLYDDAGRPVWTATRQGSGYAVVHLDYDTAGRVTQQTAYADIYGGALNANGTLSATNLETFAGSNGSGRATTNTYDAAGRLTKVTDAAKKTESYVYDARGNKTQFTNKLGSVWSYDYDDNNRLIQETAPAVIVRSGTSVASVALKTTFTYDNNGNLLSRTEAAGTTDARTTSYSYDAANRQTHITNADGTTRVVTYDAQGRAVRQQDELGYVKFKAYDAMGRVRFEVDEDGYVTQYQYDTALNQTRIIRHATALPGLTAESYSESAMQSLVKTSSADRTLTKQFDGLGRLTREYSQGISGYNAATNSSYASNTETTYQYDGFGAVVLESHRIDATNWADTYSYYDNAGHRSALVDALGYLTTWSYNALGQVMSQTEYSQAASGVSLTSYTRGAVGTETTGYDRTTTYTYDALGRTLSQTLKGNGGNSYETSWTYDALGNQTSETNAAKGLTEKEYDALGRLTKLSGVAHAVTTGAYNATTSGRQVTDYQYSAFGDLALQTDSASAGVGGSITTQYQLDKMGRVISVTNGDGIVTTKTYDARGRQLTQKTAISVANWDGAADNYTLTQTYSYDKRGHQTGTVISGGAGNAQIQNSSYNAFGEIASSGIGTQMQYSYSYNLAGQMVRKTESNGDTRSFVYDMQGHVTQDTLEGGSGTGDDRVTLNSYDKLGRLTQQQQATISTSQAGPISAQTLDRWGNVLTSTNAVLATTTQRYNILNKVTWERLPAVNIMAADGSVTYGGIEQSYAYDALGNQTFFRNGLGNAVYWSYDNAGLLQSQTKSSGIKTEYRYDAFGQERYKGEAATQSDGIATATAQRITRSEYNKRGLLIAQGESAVNGNWRTDSLTHLYSYDQVGRRVTDSTGISFNANNTAYTRYDAAGHVLQSRSVGGTVTSYSYDNGGHKTSEQIAGLAENLQTWSYDVFGNVTQLVQGGKTTTYTLTAHKEVATATTGSEVRTYAYYGNGWVQSIEDKDTSATGNWAVLAADLAKWKSNNVGGTNMTTTSSGAVRIDSSTYTYNALGQRVTESSSSQRQVVRTATWQEAQTYGAPITKTLSETLLYSSSRTINSTYDAQGRLVQVSSPQGKVTPTILDSAVSTYGYTPPTNVNVDQASGLLALTYAYDAAGNRRQVQSQTYKTATKGVVETKNYYYLYNDDNVLTFANAAGANANYNVAASWQQDSRYLLTDALGRRIGEKAKDGNNYSYQKYDYLYGSSNVGTQYETKATTSFLDLSGTTLSKHYTRSYDDWGRLVTQSTYAMYAGEGHSLSTVGRLIGTDSYSWNSANQLTTQTSKKEVVDSEWVNPTYPTTYGSSQTAVMVTASVVNYTSYDSAGNLLSYSVDAYKTNVSYAVNATANVKDYTETHTKTYSFLGGSYQLLSDAVATTKNKWRPSSLSYYYTNTGELMYVRGTNTTVEGHDRFMVSNRDGQVMFRRDGKKLQDYYYSNGQVLGTAGNLLTPGQTAFASDFSSNVQSQSEMALTSPGTYTVQSGDTLQSIAGKLWGDSSLWYVLADANGIESNSLLTDGVQLSIPSVNETLHNTSSTFKPYNASSIIGASEAQPMAPPAPSQCGTMLVMLVVIVVAAIVTYGASTAFTGTAACASSVGTAGTASVGAAAAGTAATGMGVTGGAIAGAAVGAMAGNAAGQLVGMAIGQQDGFDLGSMFKAGVRGALSAGVGAIAGSIVGTSTEIGAIASRSALQAGGNYLVNRAMTGEGGFSWAGIAANVAGSVAGYYAGKQIAGDGTDANLLMMRDMASNFAGGWAENSARQWLGIGGKREWSDIAIDAFGNAVGNSIVGSYQKEAGDNMTAILKRQTELEKSEQQIQKLYDSGLLMASTHEMVPVGVGAFKVDKAMLAGTTENCIGSVTNGKFHELGEVLTDILGRIDDPDLNTKSWDEYFNIRNTELTDSLGASYKGAGLGVQKAYIARELIVAYGIASGADKVQIMLTDDLAMKDYLHYQADNGSIDNMYIYLNDTENLEANFTGFSKRYSKPTTLISDSSGRNNSEWGEVQMYWSPDGKSYHMTAKGIVDGEAMYYSKDGPMDADLYRNKVDMVNGNLSQKDGAGVGRINPQGETHNHGIYRMFGDLLVKPTLWNRDLAVNLAPSGRMS